mmetsp:Transcript_76373/g.128315  ORF Transcript_76373/g.128315 Transcript_76373/m.128315 type:complete len:295 (+) Transcript_76373:568-1452(+)
MRQGGVRHGRDAGGGPLRVHRHRQLAAGRDIPAGPGPPPRLRGPERQPAGGRGVLHDVGGGVPPVARPGGAAGLHRRHRVHPRLDQHGAGHCGRRGAAGPVLHRQPHAPDRSDHGRTRSAVERRPGDHPHNAGHGRAPEGEGGHRDRHRSGRGGRQRGAAGDGQRAQGEPLDDAGQLHVPPEALGGPRGGVRAVHPGRLHSAMGVPVQRRPQHGPLVRQQLLRRRRAAGRGLRPRERGRPSVRVPRGLQGRRLGPVERLLGHVRGRGHDAVPARPMARGRWRSVVPGHPEAEEL